MLALFSAVSDSQEDGVRALSEMARPKLGPRPGAKNAMLNNYRYILERNWLGNGRAVNFVMLNPSTADDVVDDPTIRRCVGFAKRWLFDRLVVTNLFALRATDPSELARLALRDRNMAIGQHNDLRISEAAARCDVIVAAWGDQGQLADERAAEVLAGPLGGKLIYCIAKTFRGCPCHPVRAKYTDIPLVFRYCEHSRPVTPVQGETENTEETK